VSSRRSSVRTPHGVVQYDVVACDGPECPQAGISSALLGWLQLDNLGTPVNTLGSKLQLLPVDFCSKQCLIRWIAPEGVKPSTEPS
jgi:hypothetical protein